MDQHPLKPTRRHPRWLRILGPGLITGAADDDPSGIATLWLTFIIMSVCALVMIAASFFR